MRPGQGPPEPGRPGAAPGRYAAALLFSLALLVRLLYLMEVGDSPYFATLVLDAHEYGRLAEGILAGNWLLDYANNYVHGPLYAYFLALLEFCGLHYGAIRLVQAALGALSCLLVFRLGAHFFPAPAPLIAGVLAALYWPFVFYSGEILATTLVILIELLLALALLNWVRRRSWRPAALAGVLLGLLVMARSNTLLLLPAALGCLLGAGAGERRRGLLAFALGLGLTLAPFLARTYRVQGTPLPFQGAWSFYLGNNPAADGTPYARQGLSWQRLEILPFQQGLSTPSARSAFYLRRGLRFIRRHPTAYLRLLYAKFRLFWNAFEVPVSADLHYYEARSLLHRLLVLDFGVLAPLALAAMLWPGRRRRRYLLLYGFVLAYVLSGLLFSVCARYRLPALPFLLVFAAGALVRLKEWLAAGGRRRAAAFLALAGGAALFAHTGVEAAEVDHLRPDWLLGHVYLRQRHYARAAAAFARGLERSPGDADLYNSLGATREFQHREPEAEAAYLRALALAPDHSRARLNLGILYLKQRRFAAARAAFEAVLRRDPRPQVQYEGHYQLGQLYLRERAYREAYAAFDRALALRESPRAHYGRAAACAHLGRRAEQRRALERAVALDSTFAPAWRNLGVLYFQSGNYAAAEKALRSALRHQPASIAARRNLEALYQRLGRPQRLEGAPSPSP